jgi:hypothetical protein
MVQALQRETMKIREVPCDVQLGNLALAALKVLRSSQPAIEQQNRLMQLFAVPNEGAILRDVDDLGDEATDGLFLFRADIVSGAQLLQMDFDH